MKKKIIMATLPLMALFGRAEVKITEIMADNDGSLLTADGKAEDWIELHNPGATDVDISGWRLSDKTGDKAWKKGETLPAGTVVPAGGYLIVWADDFTGWTNGEIHVNLGFSAKGEAVALAAAEGEIVDSFEFGPQHSGVSFGRDPSDPDRLVYFGTPTPGATNGNDGIADGACFNVRINELMAENGGKCPNAAGEAMDWLELYNAGESDVDVSGWGFQDDPMKAWGKWKTLPEGSVVPAGGYLLVWGDNKDFNSFTGITNGEVHVNMGLSKKGEGLYLALTNGLGTVVRIDGVDFPAQFPDVSYGRDPSDTVKWLFFTNATPGAANGTSGLEKYPPEEEQGDGDDESDGPLEGEFAVVFDESRPVAGVAMKAVVTGERTGQLSFAWSVREPTGEYGDVVCEGREYTPTEADYEHWIRVVATDEADRSASREFYFSKLPIIYINTDDGLPVTVKTEYKDASIRIQGNAEFGEQFDGRMEIKGRGNSSWSFPKKPYKLKLEKKTDLFGFGKNKHWVLISNWLDVCGMRNWMASSLAKELGIVGMDMIWVQVVLNGSYEGTYMLCEHIRVGADRVDVFDWSDTIESEGHVDEDLAWLDSEADVDFSGGYIFELDYRYDEVSKFTTTNGLKVMFNTPEFACTSQKMMAYAQELWSDFDTSYRTEDGYCGGSHYSEIADIDSMVSFWLVNQALCNSDSTAYSRYAYKDRGKVLTFGPVWDFDVSAHSMKRPYRGGDPTVWAFQYFDADYNLFREWADDPWFCLKLAESYWDKVRPFLMNLLDSGAYDARIDYLREAGAANDKRWDREDQYAEPDDMQHPRSFNGELGDAAVVRDFLARRLEWLDGQCSSLDILVKNLQVAQSASPYAKDDVMLAISVGNGKDAASWNATTDFVLNKGETAPQVRVLVSSDAVVKIHAYVNGLRYGVYDVTAGKCEFTVSAKKLVAAWGHRDMVSLIAKDVDGKTIARNYLTILNSGKPTVVINEVMADNGGSLLTADGNASDWIELYNPGATDMDISGWRLCDNPEKKWKKWEALPEGTVVPAGGYLIVWADDFTGLTNGEVHVNLGLSSKGEAVALAAAEGEIVDSFEFGPQYADVSFGRDPSDLDRLVYFGTPTPAAANGDGGREALVFTIDFDANGGSAVASETNEYDAVISAPESTRTGYTFGGWYEAGAAEPFAFSTMPARDVALTARWRANSYTVAYDPSGGDGEVSVSNATYDVGFEVAGCAFAKTGYTFSNWTNAEGVAFAPGTSVLNLTAEADGRVMLYAYWMPTNFNVVYELNGGVNAVENPAVYTIEDAITLAVPTRTGYVFNGWTPDGGVIAKGSTGDRTFTANWEEIVVQPMVVGEADTHVDVARGEVAPFADAASVYDGLLYEDEKIVGSVQVKVAKGKVDKKSGVFSAKVTATVQLAGAAKKLSFKGGIADEKGTVTEMSDKNGNTLAVTVGVKGLGGEFRRSRSDSPYRIDGARNVFGGQSAEDKESASAAASRYQGVYNVAFDDGALSISVDKKGKAKIAGTVEGNKMGATSQLVVGKDSAVVPVVIAKKVNLSFCLWVMADETVEVRGIEGAVADRPNALKSGAKFGVDGAAVVRALPGLFGEYLPNGIDVVANGTKWTVAGGAKAGKVAFAKGGNTVDESKLGANPSGLKLTYKSKDGTFKGSFRVHSLESNGKIKAYTATVTGVMIGAKGHGTATIKKPAHTFLVTIE